MAQPRLSNIARQSWGKGNPIYRFGNITNSVVNIGNNNRLYINKDGNAIVDRQAPNQRPKIRRRSTPVILGRPKHSINLLDRAVEKKNVKESVRSGSCLEFYGVEGVGKSTLLRYLSSLPQMQLPDGLVVIEKGLPLDDLLQELFDAFYHCDQLYKLKWVEYERRFEAIRALILLDNFNLTREDTQKLLNILPNCLFILASNEQHLWDRGNAVHLAGLPLIDAMTLFQQRIDRQFTEREALIVQSICKSLQGNPLHIVQVAARVRQDGKSIQEIARQISGAEPRERILEQALANLSGGAKAFLALLATFRNVPVPAEHINEMIQNVQLGPTIKELLNRGLIKAHSPSYSLTGNLGSYLSRNWNLTQWNEIALRHFTDWVSRSLSSEQILDSAPALMATIENAVSANRWQEVLKIGVAVEPGFVIGRRWGTWEKLLNLLMKAGMAMKDRAIEGWVLHQLGSRALCLDNLQEAKVLLSRALELRRAIGDHSGASASQHNLSQLGGGTPTSSRGGMSGKGWIIPVVGVVAIAVTLMTSRNTPPPNPTVNFTDTPNMTSMITETITPSVTHTIIPTTAGSPSIAPTKTNTPSITPTRTNTPSITPTRTNTPSSTPSTTSTNTQVPTTTSPPNYPPPPPGIISPKENSSYYCSGTSLSLQWMKPSDPSGISSYWVKLDYYDKYSAYNWVNLVNQEVYKTNFDVTYYINYYCGSKFRWEVSAKDNEGLWGGATLTSFYSDFPIPTTAVPPPPIIQIGPLLSLFCNLPWITTENDVNRPGMDLPNMPRTQIEVGIDTTLMTLTGCQSLCAEYADCKAYTFIYSGHECWLKSDQPGAYSTIGMVSGIKSCAAVTSCTSQKMTKEIGKDRQGMDYWNGAVSGGESACSQMCLTNEKCKAYTYRKSDQRCYLKDDIPTQTTFVGLISGIKYCDQQK